MARAVSTQRKVINTAARWAIGLLIFFPILWTILTSFKTEAEAIANPPVFLFFDWTLENYAVVQERSNYMRFLWNSVIIAGGSTLLGILIAVPAAWSMAFVPVEADQGHPAVDAVDQDAARGGCALPDLPAVHSAGRAGQPRWR
jgi:sorbitol/mannitol transport system permease protein